MHGEIDVLIAMLGLQQIRAQFLTASESYYVDRTILLVPPLKPVGSMAELLLPFSFEAWIFIIAVFLVTILSSFSILSSGKIRNLVFGQNIRTPILNILVTILGGVLQKLPSTNFARYILTMLTIFCFVIRSGFYQGKLFGILKSENLEKEIPTILEYHEQKYDFYMYSGLATRFKEFKFYKE